MVAREYGIPAVVGVAGATGQIATGQQITVDGINGWSHRMRDVQTGMAL